MSINLYQEVIMDHFKNPRHQRKLDPGEVRVEKLNPSCGDRIRVAVESEGDVLREVICELQACAIAVASASMMAAAVRGKSEAFFEAMKADVEALLLHDLEPGADLGDLSALVSVRAFPVRIPCALLPWNALAEGLAGDLS